MRLNRLDLNQLICLDALLAEKSVSRAATRVNLSQPAMSAALTRLRDYFDDPLLMRIGRSMVVTSFAATLVEPVRNVLLQAQAIAARRPENDPAKIQRDITLTASDYMTTVVLQDIMKRAASEAPGIRITIRPVSEFFGELLDSGEVELMVSSTAAFIPGHPSERLFNEHYSCIAWSENPDIGDRISADEYYELGHVAIEWGRGRILTHDQDASDKANRRRRNEVTVSNFNMAPGFIVGTRRIATMQTRLAQVMARQWPIRILPCPIVIPPIEIGMQWNKHLTDDIALAWFRQLLRDVAKDLSRNARRKRPRSDNRS